MSIATTLGRWHSRFFRVKDHDNHISRVIENQPFSNIELNSDIISGLITSQTLIAESMAKMPLEIYKSGKGKSKVTDHKLYRMLHNRVNNYTTSFSFINSMVLDMLRWGNSYARIYRNNEGSITRIVKLNINQVGNGFIKKGELYFPIDGKNTHYDNLLHFKLNSDYSDDVLGLSYAQALQKNLSVAWQAMNVSENHYANGLHTTRFLKSTLTNGDPKAQKQAIDTFMDNYKGSKNASKLVSLPHFTDIVDSPINFDDARVLESLGFNYVQIAALHKIPKELIGFGEIKKLEDTLNAFKALALAPICRAMRQELEMKLLSDEEIADGISIEFNMNSLMATDITTKSNYYRTMSHIGALSPNEVRTFEDMSHYANGDQHMIQVQMIPNELNQGQYFNNDKNE